MAGSRGREANSSGLLGKGPRARMPRGSTAAGLAKHAHCPIAVVHRAYCLWRQRCGSASSASRSQFPCSAAAS